jgi:hypothetical protein
VKKAGTNTNRLPAKVKGRGIVNPASADWGLSNVKQAIIGPITPPKLVIASVCLVLSITHNCPVSVAGAMPVTGV